MSDDYPPAFFNAFCEIFQSNTYHLLCTWHVLRAWNQALNSKIKDSTVRQTFNDKLITIQRESDRLKFEKESNIFIRNLITDEATKEFAQYLLQNYFTRPEQWEFCYRRNAGVNTNMKVERWHRAIKYEEAQGKVIRLDN